jgi:hypothetical protein
MRIQRNYCDICGAEIKRGSGLFEAGITISNPSGSNDFYRSGFKGTDAHKIDICHKCMDKVLGFVSSTTQMTHPTPPNSEYFGRPFHDKDYWFKPPGGGAVCLNNPGPWREIIGVMAARDWLLAGIRESNRHTGPSYTDIQAMHHAEDMAHHWLQWASSPSDNTSLDVTHKYQEHGMAER